MRTYMIGNDGIALCRKPPATVSEGEIVLTSKKELHAAPLNGKRLLALRNALPGVDIRRQAEPLALPSDDEPREVAAQEAHNAPSDGTAISGL